MTAELEAESSRQETEAALIRGLKEARPEAAAELYDRFAPSLLTFALAWFPADRPLAEDVVVHSLANAVHHIRSFNPHRASLLTWLYGIARRQLRDELRRQARRKSVPAAAQSPLETAVDTPGPGDVSAEVAARVDSQRLLTRLAAELSALEYEMLILHSLNQLSDKEIGRVVGRSERAVHSLLHRAKTKARERLVRNEF